MDAEKGGKVRRDHNAAQRRTASWCGDHACHTDLPQRFTIALPLLNKFVRIPVCGLIAQYNATELPAGPNRLPLLMRDILVKRLTFRGFIVLDFGSQLRDFVTNMSGWLRGGLVKYREDVTDGLENAPRELIGLLKGENFGKSQRRG